MSVEAIAIAMHHSRATKSSTIAVLIGIANHDGDGGAWPTVSTLAHYARVQRRQVQREVAELERLGEIRRDIQGGGTVEVAHYDRPNLYHFVLQCPPHCDRSKNHKLICESCNKPLPKSFQTTRHHPDCDPKIALADPVSSVTPHVTQDARGASPVTPKPSLEPNQRLKEETHLPNRAHAHEGDASGEVLYAAAIAAKRERQGRMTPASDVFDLAASLRAATAPKEPLAIPDDELCPKRLAAPHAYNKGGECIDCGAPSADRINEQTGEVA